MKYLICTRPSGQYPRNIPVADFCNLVAYYMKKKGNEVLIVYTHRAPFKDEIEWLTENNLKWKVLASTHYYNKNPKYFIRLYKILKTEKPDVVEFHVPSVPMGLLTSRLKRIKNMIIWNHSLSFYRHDKLSEKISSKIQTFRSNIYFKIATAIIANSEANKSDLIKHHKVNPAKVHVKHLGTFPPLFEETNAVKRELMIACVGRYIKSKGQDVLLKALPKIIAKYPDLKVIFVGAGHPDELKTLAKDLNIFDNCIFMGESKKGDVYKVLRRASISVFPTLLEAFGLVAIDSIFCGTPLIASDTGGVSEIIQHNKNGILVKPGNIKQLESAILTLLGDNKMRDELSKNAIERSKYFDIHTRAEAYADWLTQNYN